MLKFEWPLILPENEDVKPLAAATFDISEYVVDIAEGRSAPGLQPLAGGVTLHSPAMRAPRIWDRRRPRCCVSFPTPTSHVIERCSGHGGSWGVRKETQETGAQNGKPVLAKSVAKWAISFRIVRWPALHIMQAVEAPAAKSGGPHLPPIPNIPSKCWPAPTGCWRHR